MNLSSYLYVLIRKEKTMDRTRKGNSGQTLPKVHSAEEITWEA